MAHTKCRLLGSRSKIHPVRHREKSKVLHHFQPVVSTTSFSVSMAALSMTV